VERRVINPWTWQDPYAFVQASEVTGAERTLFVAGQASVDDEGQPLHAGDMRAQLGRAFDNLETVLGAAGFTLGDVQRLSYFTTDIDGFFAAHDVVVARLGAAGCRAVGSLVGVSRLAFPGLLIELEATAVK
jgi:enamine deaminase RidA (YjgF/YER057c/UK114 family)